MQFSGSRRSADPPMRRLRWFLLPIVLVRPGQKAGVGVSSAAL